MHGEVLLRQCCRLKEGDKHTDDQIQTRSKIKESARLVTVMDLLLEGSIHKANI